MSPIIKKAYFFKNNRNITDTFLKKCLNYLKCLK